MLFSLLLKKDFIKAKYKFGIQDLVQVHHIIPLEWKNHEKLFDYNVYSGSNLILLPTKLGKEKLNTIRRVHEGGHMKYNKYIKECLDNGYDPYLLSENIREKLTTNQDIPWK